MAMIAIVRLIVIHTNTLSLTLTLSLSRKAVFQLTVILTNILVYAVISTALLIMK